MAAADSKKQATMTLEARPRSAKRSGSEVDISEWSSVIYFSCLTTLTKYDISGALPPSPSNYLSVSSGAGATWRNAHTTRLHGVYNTTRNPRAARSFFRLFRLFLSLSSDSRTLLRDRRECLHLSPPAAYASPDASHKERFIVWRPPRARWTRREFLPRHSRVAAGDKTPTKPALLITAGMTGPICIRAAFTAAALSESRRGKEKKKEWSSDGHRRDRSLPQREEMSSIVVKNGSSLLPRSILGLLAGWKFVHGRFIALNVAWISATVSD